MQQIIEKPELIEHTKPVKKENLKFCSTEGIEIVGKVLHFLAQWLIDNLKEKIEFYHKEIQADLESTVEPNMITPSKSGRTVRKKKENNNEFLEL